MSESYTYAVARIRANELALFNDQAIEQLLAAKSYEECIRLLQDKGWGGMEANPTAEGLLAEEREKTWALMRELVPDLSVFDVFLYTNDYHNLKAAIKLVCTGSEDFGLFISHGTIDHRELLHAVQERDWGSLPDSMRGPAEEAYTALAQTRDGQLCDIILDRAALDAVYAAGKASRDELVRRYAELTVAAADIKTAVRCARTGKPMDFIRRALAECDSLSVSRLAKAAAEGLDSICDLLSTTDYADAVEVLRQSPSAFERWCDNLIIRYIRPQQFQSFGIGPLAAYILGRENEIKSVRIILSGKLNQLSDQSIRERVREMYV
ncbi:V-type ATPase subunit [Anaerotruncus sp. 1XD42-93]|uniref:V0D/AC39 family V-type ATPase subunit n=1 Tax=Anaerotruncus sp. 1XD42-93 TaxID=2320853 RepID=UPI000EA23F4D|nr:V-type ATPase subunit [Anaerotruncus sp. 1XD42-93]NBK17369.1 V-type ATP synthase subunit C [Anaerotruncus sp. 1XD42-93]RKJ95975.1 V-type ATP synthase subunit C [Anaerotruncus sp. 1XD22-93]